MAKFISFIPVVFFLFSAVLFQSKGSLISDEQNQGLFLPFKTITLVSDRKEVEFRRGSDLNERFPEGDNLSLLMKILRSALMSEYELSKKFKGEGNVLLDYIRELNLMPQSVVPQKYTFQADEFDSYLNNIFLQIAIPTKFADSVQRSLKEALKSNEKDWIGVDLLFSNEEGTKSNYAYIFGKYNEPLKKMYILFGYLFNDFDFILPAPVVEIRKNDGNKWEVVQLVLDTAGSNIAEQDVKTALDYFQLVTFKQFIEEVCVTNDQILSSMLLSLAEANTKEEKNFTSKWFDALDFLKFSVGNVTGMWNGVVNSFKTEKKSEIKQTLTGKGFSFFSQSAQVRKSLGIKAEFYPKYKENLLRSLQVPETRRQEFLDVLDTFEYSDEETWNAYQTLFSINSQGDCKFVFILANRNQTTSKINFIYSDMKATFKLAPDVMVIQQSNSYLGGIFSESKLMFKDIPRGVTNEDLKAVYDFFYVVSFKNFADVLGIKVALPDLNSTN